MKKSCGKIIELLDDAHMEVNESLGKSLGKNLNKQIIKCIEC